MKLFMKFFKNLGLSDTEIKIVKKILLISTISMFLSVAGFWGYQSFVKKSNISDLKIIDDPMKVKPLDIEANYEIAKSSLQSNDFERAILHLRRVVELRKDDFTARCLLGDAFLEAGEYQNAIAEYDYLSAKTIPDTLSSRICSRKAIALFYMKENSASTEALKKCIELFPKNAESYCFLGQIEAAQAIPSQSAIDNIYKALSLDSNYVEAWYQLARYYMELKQYTKARELLLRAIEINPLHEKSQSRLGMAYYYLQIYDLAKKAYQTALALNPGDFNTRYNLAEVYYADGDTARAVKEYKLTLKNNPGHVEANFKLGLILLVNNMTKEAIIHLEQAAHSDKNNNRILIQLAIAYEKLDDKAKALSIYQNILKIDALNTIALQKIKLLSE